MSKENIQNQHDPLTLTNKTIIGTAGATSLLSRGEKGTDPLKRTP
jgi:hypothetical protein